VYSPKTGHRYFEAIYSGRDLYENYRIGWLQQHIPLAKWQRTVSTAIWGALVYIPSVLFVSSVQFRCTIYLAQLPPSTRSRISHRWCCLVVVLQLTRHRWALWVEVSYARMDRWGFSGNSYIGQFPWVCWVRRGSFQWWDWLANGLEEEDRETFRRGGKAASEWDPFIVTLEHARLTEMMTPPRKGGCLRQQKITVLAMRGFEVNGVLFWRKICGQIVFWLRLAFWLRYFPAHSNFAVTQSS